MVFLRYIWALIINFDKVFLIGLGLGAVLYNTSFINLGKLSILLSMFGLFLIYYFPLSRSLLYYLEHCFPQLSNLPTDAKGLILLGGCFSHLENESEGRPIYNQAAGRIIEFITLARCYPNLPIVITGSRMEAILTQKLFDEMGIDSKRVVVEDQSNNTYDNSKNTYKLIKPHEKERWVLVTSASHLPRSFGLFTKIGWNIIPYPVDYHTKKLSWKKWLQTWGDPQNGVYWGLALNEYAGLINNYLLKRSSSLIPSDEISS